MIWNEAGAEFHIISPRGIHCDIEQVTVLNNRFIVCLPLYPNQPHGIRVKRKCNQVSSVLGAFFSFETRFLSLSVLLPKRSMLCCCCMCMVGIYFSVHLCFPFAFRSHSLIAVLLRLLFLWVVPNVSAIVTLLKELSWD